MAKKGTDTVWMTYHSAYGGESLRTDPKTALERVERTLARFAPGTEPNEVELRLDDEQTEALYRATRTGGAPHGADPAAVWAAQGGGAHPLLGPLEALLGPGQREVWASGACGDLWCTKWRVRDEAQVKAMWPALLSALHANLDAPRVHTSWGGRARGDAPTTPLSLVVHWRCDLRRLDGVNPFVGPKDRNRRLAEGSRIILFLGEGASGIFDLTAPYSELHAEFAAWERSFIEHLGATLHDGHWRRTFIHPEGSPTHAHWVPGRYRRKDWVDGEGGLSLAPQGPWTPLVEELLAPRLSSSRAYDLRPLLAAQPLAPTVAALVRGMGPLKGAALDRGADVLRLLVEKADDRSVLQPVVEALFADPPNIAVSRKVGRGFDSAFSEPWLSGLILEQLDQKKPSAAVLPFTEEAVSYRYEGADVSNRAWTLGQLLRRLRAKGAATYRQVFCGALARCAAPGSWPTLLLEAASLPPKDDDTGTYSWAQGALERWAGPEGGRWAVTDPAFAPWQDRLPPIDFNYLRPPHPVKLTLTEAERADLMAREAAWLGER
jgi:hypothetical protein